MRRLLRSLKEQEIVYLAMTGFILVLAALLFLFFSRENQRSRMSMEYEADRVASSLLVRFLRDGQLDTGTLDRRILAFGIYSDRGAPLLLYGSAPPLLTSGDGENPWTRFQVTKARIILTRPLGMAPMMPGMPHMMDHRFPSGQPERRPPVFRNIVHIEIERSFFAAGSQRFRITLLLIFVLVTLIMAALGYIYNRNRRYRQKAESQRQLIQLGEAARTLVHEIRNPLGSIRIQSSLLAKKLSGPDRSHTDIINQEVERLNLLSARVGEFLRNPSGRPVAIDLGAYLHDLSGRLEYPVRMPNAGGESWMIRFDRDRLPSVCENIIRNAHESQPADGEVEIALGSEDEFIVMEVLDRGAGIPERDHERVFEPFYTTKSEGFGIGLSTARRLVEAMGGRITISGRRGGGTSVKLYFRREEKHGEHGEHERPHRG
jgi:two-component system sensor histidine kinase HydH